MRTIALRFVGMIIGFVLAGTLAGVSIAYFTQTGTGFSLGSPRDGHRGSHVTLLHPEGLAIDLALIEEERLIPDFRPPDSIRLGITPLYLDGDDVDEAVRRIVRVVDSGAFERHRDRSVGVT